METSNPTPCHHSKIFFEINEWIATWDFFQPFSGCNCSTNFLMIIIEQSLKLMCLKSWWSCSFAQDIGALHRKRSLKYSWNSTSLLGAFSLQARQNHHVYSVTAISLCGLKLLLKHRTKWVFQSTLAQAYMDIICAKASEGVCMMLLWLCSWGVPSLHNWVGLRAEGLIA
jgi:hypothetical protein